jgi:hypothetical protein
MLLLEGARFNDEIHRLPTGQSSFIPRGVYRFLTHEAANRHQEECLAAGMAQIIRDRSSPEHAYCNKKQCVTNNPWLR